MVIYKGMNSLSHEERYTAIKAGSVYLLPETVEREWDTQTVHYSSYEELIEQMSPKCQTSSRKVLLHFLAAKRLMEQVFETLLAEYGEELGELGGITVVSQGVVLFSAHHTNPEWSRVLVLNLEQIAKAAQQFHETHKTAIQLDRVDKAFILLGAATIITLMCLMYRKL
jgi:hypothetical protein